VALNFTCGAAHFLTWLDQHVVEPLKISLRMKMAQELSYGDLQRSLPEENGLICRLQRLHPVNNDFG
jgi:hypothetical protein